MLPADVLGVGDDMREARLPVETNAVVGRIPVAYERTVKILTEDGLCRIRGPMPVYMEGEFQRVKRISEGQIFNRYT
jgi:hypothetical protein